MTAPRYAIAVRCEPHCEDDHEHIWWDADLPEIRVGTSIRLERTETGWMWKPLKAGLAHVFDRTDAQFHGARTWVDAPEEDR